MKIELIGLDDRFHLRDTPLEMDIRKRMNLSYA